MGSGKLWAIGALVLAGGAVGCTLLTGLDSLSETSGGASASGSAPEASTPEAPVDARVLDAEPGGDVTDVSPGSPDTADPADSAVDRGGCVPGTSCGPGDACNVTPTCDYAGACIAHPLPDGTSCGTSMNACQHMACESGACVTVNDDGLACTATGNPCRPNGSCSGGACVAGAGLADGQQYDGDPLDRCCGGNPTQVNTDSDCGACGVACNNGNVCVNTHGGHWYCTCASNFPDCWSGCCATIYGAPYVCAADTAASCAGPTTPIACPGNAINTNAYPVGPRYCHY